MCCQGTVVGEEEVMYDGECGFGLWLEFAQVEQVSICAEGERYMYTVSAVMELYIE